jgi:hypothetical protein
MENTANILTIREVASILRCSKAHVANVMSGEVAGIERLTHLSVGRRKLVRRDWLEHWWRTGALGSHAGQDRTLKTQERGQFMRRKQFQRGSVSARQHGPRKVWVAQWWENGGKRSKVLGQIPEVSKGQAEAMLSKILAPINETAGQLLAPTFTFETIRQWCVLSGYAEQVEGIDAKPVRDRHRTVPVPDLRRTPHAHDRSADMQRFLEQKATTYSASIVGHLRW